MKWELLFSDIKYLIHIWNELVKNSTCETSVCEPCILHMKWKIQIWKLISQMKFSFHIWNWNNSHMKFYFHMWNCMWNLCQGTPIVSHVVLGYHQIHSVVKQDYCTNNAPEKVKGLTNVVFHLIYSSYHGNKVAWSTFLKFSSVHLCWSFVSLARSATLVAMCGPTTLNLTLINTILRLTWATGCRGFLWLEVHWVSYLVALYPTKSLRTGDFMPECGCWSSVR